MSAEHSSVGGTLTTGIQNVSAILPIIGTDQCENHVGSALEGGYLYAAAAPLSIFGCLGIIKCGIAVLVSSISIPKAPAFLRNRYKNPIQGRWMGARILGNAGFKLQGSVASLIGMDNLNKKHFKAESQLLQILEEKHIDDPDKISIEWKSRQWNIMLVFFTLVAAGMSIIPYITLLLGSNSWRPTRHLPWIFPLLRTAGSCLAAVCCQFLIQWRVIYLMKSRVLFMAIHRRLLDNVLKNKKADLDSWLQHEIAWDADLPSEQCIWNLEQLFSFEGSLTSQKNDAKEELDHISIEMESITTTSTNRSTSMFWASTGPPKFPQGLFNRDFVFDCNTLRRLRRKHFPDYTLDRNMALIAWITLFLSIPATVAGYVGCFTLVNASPGNGPLIWLGLEAALSVIRILVWAWNPTFDEDTGIDIKLKLTEQPPMVTTEEYNPWFPRLKIEGRDPLALVPERQFLERITPYTGPLEQFRIRDSANNALYFTLTTDYGDYDPIGRNFQSLLLTVLDINKRNAVTLMRVKNVDTFFAATAVYNPISGEMEVTLHTVIHENHPHRTKEPVLFEALLGYHTSVLSALNQPKIRDLTATLGRKWDLFPLTTDMHPNERTGVNQTQLTLTVHDLLYLDRGYEHHLKTRLIETWGEWIVTSMGGIYDEALFDCFKFKAIADETVTSPDAKRELADLDQLMGWEWTRRELACIDLSIKLEDMLQVRMELCIDKIGKERKSLKLMEWMRREFDIGRRKRLDKERRDAKERMEKAMQEASDRTRMEGRDYGWPKLLWFIESQWSAAITSGRAPLQDANLELDFFIQRTDRHVELQQRFSHCLLQREYERLMMEAAVAAVNNIQWDPNVDGQRQKMDCVYEYPSPDEQAIRRFVSLSNSSSNGKACTAIVYDARNRSEETICNVIQKSTTRSLINVNPAIVASSSIENDHLLFLSCQGVTPEPAFIQRNRDRWWERAEQESCNSSTFYFSPDDVDDRACSSHSGTIAHIFIFFAFSSRLRLRLLHGSNDGASVSIQEGGKELATIASIDMPQALRLQDIELAELGPGRHELEVVVDPSDRNGNYLLRHIFVEFSESAVPDSPVTGVVGVDHLIQSATGDGSADNQPQVTSSQIEELSEMTNGLATPDKTLENPDELNDGT